MRNRIKFGKTIFFIVSLIPIFLVMWIKVNTFWALLFYLIMSIYLSIITFNENTKEKWFEEIFSKFVLLVLFFLPSLIVFNFMALPYLALFSFIVSIVTVIKIILKKNTSNL